MNKVSPIKVCYANNNTHTQNKKITKNNRRNSNITKKEEEYCTTKIVIFKIFQSIEIMLKKYCEKTKSEAKYYTCIYSIVKIW